MEDIYIIGDGGMAKDVIFLINEINRKTKQWNVAGVITKEQEKIGSYFSNIEIVGNNDFISNKEGPLNIVIAIASPLILNKLYTLFKKKNNLHFPNLIHPDVVVDWDNFKFGEGNIITAGVRMTTNIRIGSCNIFGNSSTIGHDVTMGDFNVVNPGANISGAVRIEDSVLLGTGSQVLQGLNINESIVVGAGAVVTKSLVEDGTYIGIPAKKINRGK